MADLEQGWRWWLRFIVVPLLAGSGVTAVVIAFINRAPIPSSSQPTSMKPLTTCSQAVFADYPKGVWNVRGVKIRTGSPDTSFSRELIFSGPTRGTWYQG